ncbi:centromere protein N-like [Lingula anatina]|uniref:Centromere protein N-like n=1 Tax=Lingula anatina TaxID=7574 RepID=A0A1S3IWN8_LINAN|nr:centromere protein N-like [Lingula anatina]|eukprot:XP_013402605.1 centromere protein N-like [Lingula anatina]
MGLLTIDMLQHSSSKTWTVWLSTELHGSEGYAETPQAFRRRLKTALESYFMLDIQVMEHQKALWVRIYIHEDTKYQANNTVYAVYYPHSPVLILTAIKAANREYIIQAFSNTLSAGELEEQMLSGHCLSSLAQLSLNKYSQGYFSHYRLGQVDINALARGEKRKRKIEEEEEVLDERITYENIKDKQRSKKILQDTFGSNEQPSLERLEYKMETNFRGGNCAPHFAKNKEPFRCRVKFEGRNVLEGIKNLGKAGYATLPLPAHLARVPSLAKNTIILGNKKSKRQ